jgi:hypothetical protein
MIITRGAIRERVTGDGRFVGETGVEGMIQEEAALARCIAFTRRAAP